MGDLVSLADLASSSGDLILIGRGGYAAVFEHPDYPNLVFRFPTKDNSFSEFYEDLVFNPFLCIPIGTYNLNLSVSSADSQPSLTKINNGFVQILEKCDGSLSD